MFARAVSIADTGKLTLAHVTLYTLNIYGVCPCRPLQTRKMRCDPILGRKNWLFAGSDKGGHTAAVLSSFVASCRRHEIDPFAYLRDVLTNFAPCPINEIDQFLPDCWNAARATKQA